MRRHEAIEAILTLLANDDIALFSTGMISREAYSIRDRTTNFYMLGSMGLLSSVALGLAMNTDQLVVAFDGDGSALMDMGTMALIAYQKPENLIHVVLDNASYESTGGQPTISNDIDLLSVARAVGYAKAFHAAQMEELNSFLEDAMRARGPIFILLKVTRGSHSDTPRVSLLPTELVQRLKTS